MKDDPTGKLYDDLFSAAKREAAPEETRRRIAATLKASSNLSPALDLPSTKRHRVPLGFLLAAAALGVLVLVLTSTGDQQIDISAESLAYSSRQGDTGPSTSQAAPVGSDPITAKQQSPQEQRPKREAKPKATSPRTAPVEAPSSSTQSKPKQLRSPATLEQELASVQQARAALSRGQANAALAELDRFARDFGWRQLSAESSLVRIEALHRLGRESEGQDLARRFVEQHPNNPLVDRARKFGSEPETSNERAESSSKEEQP